jgi:DinB superfamily
MRSKTKLKLVLHAQTPRLNKSMEILTQKFIATLKIASAQLSKISEADSEKFPAPGKWSPKQVIGHLIDSASNNHQRFVRIQFQDGLAMPGYEQEQWVAAQNYQNEPWSQLLSFWQNYNQHLAHLIANIPAEKLSHLVRIGEGESVTLKFLIEDYVAHLRQHLQQILD